MNASIARTGLVDRIAMAVSGLCVVHCVATALLLGTMSTVGGLLGSHMIHEVGLIVALVLGVIGLGSGILTHRRFLPPAVGGLGIGVMAAALALPHGGYEMAATMIGVGLLATGHYLNRLALL